MRLVQPKFQSMRVAVSLKCDIRCSFKFEAKKSNDTSVRKEWIPHWQVQVRNERLIIICPTVPKLRENMSLALLNSVFTGCVYFGRKTRRRVPVRSGRPGIWLYLKNCLSKSKSASCLRNTKNTSGGVFRVFIAAEFETSCALTEISTENGCRACPRHFRQKQTPHF